MEEQVNNPIFAESSEEIEQKVQEELKKEEEAAAADSLCLNPNSGDLSLL